MSPSSFGTASRPPPLIDVDCNLIHTDLLSIAPDPSSPLSTLTHPSVPQSNIIAVLSPSSTIAESRQMIDLLSSSSTSANDAPATQVKIKTTAGVHPYHATTDVGNDMTALENILSSSATHVSCVGECGLDYSEGFPPPHLQKPYFEKQLDLAMRYQKPLFVHERLAHEDTLAAIDAARERSAVADDDDGKASSSSSSLPAIIVHCFTGTEEELKEYIRRGYCVSVSGYVLRKGEGPEDLRRCLRAGVIPLDRLMIETDAPYMGFEGCRASFLECEPEEKYAGLNGKKRKRLRTAIYPNVPSSLGLVFEEVRRLLNEGRVERMEEELGVEELARVFNKNAVAFFWF